MDPMGNYNLWMMIINSFINLSKDYFSDKLPVHQSIGLVQKVLEIASTSLGLTFTLVFSAFNMTIPYAMFILIVTLEITRSVYVTYRLVKGLVL